MNENIEYLQHEINLYKNIPYKERHKEKRRNYQITHSNENHKDLIDISILHGLTLAELVEIILNHFLKCRKTFKKNINKLNKRSKRENILNKKLKDYGIIKYNR